jgi:hypothetical protein
VIEFCVSGLAVISVSGLSCMHTWLIARMETTNEDVSLLRIRHSDFFSCWMCANAVPRFTSFSHEGFTLYCHAGLCYTHEYWSRFLQYIAILVKVSAMYCILVVYCTSYQRHYDAPGSFSFKTLSFILAACLTFSTSAYTPYST